MNTTRYIPYDGKTVVVTHFPPSYQLCHARFVGEQLSPYFNANCDDLIEKYHLDSVYMTTPITDEPRCRQIADHSSGFVYTVAVLGVTGCSGEGDGAPLTLARCRGAHRS